MAVKFASSLPTLVPAGDGQGDGVVAVGDREGGSFQAAYPADEAA